MRRTVLLPVLGRELTPPAPEALCFLCYKAPGMRLKGRRCQQKRFRDKAQGPLSRLLHDSCLENVLRSHEPECPSLCPASAGHAALGLPGCALSRSLPVTPAPESLEHPSLDLPLPHLPKRHDNCFMLGFVLSLEEERRHTKV